MEYSEENQPIRTPLRLWLTAIGVCFGTAFPTYFSLYFPNNARPVIEDFFVNSTNIDASEIHEHIWSTYTCMGTVAITVGAFLTPFYDHRFGRRKGLLLCCSLTAALLLFEILAKPLNLWIFSFLGRFFTLFVCGSITDLAPVLLNEIAPVQVSGSIGFIYPVFMCLGMAAGAATGLESLLGVAELWPYSFLVPLFCFASVIPLLLFIPETPDYVKMREPHQENVDKSLQFYHGDLAQTDNAPVADFVLSILHQAEHGPEKCASFRTFWTLISLPELRPAFFLNLAIAGSYSFSGQAVLSFYSFTLLEHANIANAAYFNLGLIVFSCLTMFCCIFVIGRLGKRRLLMISGFGTIILWTVLAGTNFIPDSLNRKPILSLCIIVLVQTFINFGIRVMLFLAVAELYPSEYKASGQALGSLLSEFLNIPIVYAMPMLLTRMGSLAYLVLVVPLLFCMLFLAKKYQDPGKKTRDFWRQASNVKRL